MLSKLINIKIFIISLSVGLFIAYIMGEQAKTVYVYPTPDNINKVLYKDDANNCYAYNPVEVDCNKHKNDISQIPGQSRSFFSED